MALRLLAPVLVLMKMVMSTPPWQPYRIKILKGLRMMLRSSKKRRRLVAPLLSSTLVLSPSPVRGFSLPTPLAAAIAAGIEGKFLIRYRPHADRFMTKPSQPSMFFTVVRGVRWIHFHHPAIFISG